MDEAVDQVEVQTPTDSSSYSEVSVAPEKPKSSHFSAEQRRELVEDKGCDVFEFPQELSPSDEVAIKKAIKSFTGGEFDNAEEETIFNSWPRGCDLAIKKGF